MNKKFFLAVLVIVLGVSIFAGSASAAIIGIKPTDTSILNLDGVVEVAVCTEFELDLYIKDLNEVPLVDENNPLVGFALSVAWDPLVSLEAFTPNSTWWSNIDVKPSPGPGVIPDKVELFGYAANEAPFEDHIIGTVLLHCVGEGETTLTPSPYFPFSINFALKDGSSFIDEHISFESLTIKQVQVVPIPSTLLLLGTGLMGLMGLRRRK